MKQISKSELFEMNLYYREVIGRGDAPAEVKLADILRLLDHIAATESEPEPAKPKRKPKAAAEVEPGQTDIFEFIGGDE